MHVVDKGFSLTSVSGGVRRQAERRVERVERLICAPAGTPMWGARRVSTTL
jgi:hypothetical protein